MRIIIFAKAIYKLEVSWFFVLLSGPKWVNSRSLYIDTLMLALFWTIENSVRGAYKIEVVLPYSVNSINLSHEDRLVTSN